MSDVREFQSIPSMAQDKFNAWGQPNSSEFLIDDRYAVMCTLDFNNLKEYSASQPTGVYDGKMWKRHDGAFDRSCPPEERRWLLCWYGPSEDPEKCSVNMREIRLSDGDLPK
jgi:hypothetical protein